MTKFGDWIRTFDIWSNDFDRDLANLTAQCEEALELQPGNDGSNHRGCNPKKCHQRALMLALAACKEFQAQYE